jgi:hypothetical protein
LLNEIRLTNAAQLLAFSRDYPSLDQLAADERLGSCDGGHCKAAAGTNPAAVDLSLGHHSHFLANEPFQISFAQFAVECQQLVNASRFDVPIDLIWHRRRWCSAAGTERKYV